MSWQINAWLDEGKSHLEILDSDSGKVQLRWTFDAADMAGMSKAEVQRLFRELLLLSCKQDLSNGRLFCAAG